MEKITIQAKAFFEIIKSRDISMWDIFSEMIDGEEKAIIFLDENNQLLMRYILPSNHEKLQADKQEFGSMLKEQLT